MSCGYFYSLLFIFGEIINILFKNKLNFKFKFTIKIFNYFKVIRWGCRPLSMLRPFNNNLDHIYFYISKWPWFVYYLTWSTIYNLFNNNSESKSLHWTSSQYITYNIKELLYQMIEEISGYKKNNIWAAGRSISESKTLGELEYITLYETCNILFIINLFIINIVHLFYFYKISAEI
jgi:hypothetical protein